MMENIERFFSVDSETEAGNEEAMLCLEALMLMFDDLLSQFGHGLENLDSNLRMENPFYKQMVVKG